MNPATVTLIATTIIGLVAAILLFRGRRVFLVSIREGVASSTSGQPPPGFVSACNDICRMYGIRSGRIEGVRTGRTVELRFSRDIPERAHQPLRNVWTPPPPGGGGGGGRRATG